ncbi:MFS transporter [Ferrimicrobium acidiphilum]|uniref:Antiseptic resistance protein n=3 Tax=Ferrimicrobium TaxID=121038 RepID=A0A0D8FS87_9ACTN|nr:MFS transporter [Ferrimicrobium acidiphilum]KJE76148.1 antiseptic resistance protein [Ferrimicrobium acidiphilum DSM 19497]
MVEAARARAPHSGLALLVIVIGVLITAVDTTIVVLALPEIQRSLHIGISSIIWVIIGYLLVITLLATQLGRLGDMFGRVRMYELGFLVFIVGSLLCALAWNEASIIGFRLLQGVGGALVAANSGAVIADTFPPEQRGKAYGYNAIGWNIGAVLGVLLGGLIVTYFSWRWIFWINVPIGLVALAVAIKVLRDHGEREKRRLDYLGTTTLGLGLFGILWGLTKLTSESLNASIIEFVIAGVILLGVFALVEQRQKEPMLNLSLFRVPTMSPTLLASLFQGLASFSVLYLLLMYLQGVRGYSPLHASLLLLPGYVVGGVVGPIGGRLADRYGAVWPATVGLVLQMVALVIYAQLGTGSAIWILSGAYVIGAVGSGGFYPANNAAVMKAAPAGSFGIASGMLRTFANIGMVFSFAAAIVVASGTISKRQAFAIFVGTSKLSAHIGTEFTSGIHNAFYLSVVLMAIAAMFSATNLKHHFSGKKTNSSNFPPKTVTPSP